MVDVKQTADQAQAACTEANRRADAAEDKLKEMKMVKAANKIATVAQQAEARKTMNTLNCQELPNWLMEIESGPGNLPSAMQDRNLASENKGKQRESLLPSTEMVLYNEWATVATHYDEEPMSEVSLVSQLGEVCQSQNIKSGIDC